MIELIQSGEGLKVKIDNRPSDYHHLKKYINDFDFSWNYDPSFMSYFLIAFSLVGNLYLLTYVKDITTFGWFWIILGNLLCWGSTHRPNRIKIKFDLNSIDMDKLKNIYNVIYKSTGIFTTDTSKTFSGIEVKKNSGANISVNIKYLKDIQKKFFKSNFKFPCYAISENCVCLFPFFCIVIDKNNKIKIGEYNILKNSFFKSSLILPEPPSDATLEGKVWKKVNKDGSKDKRYKGNYQLSKVTIYNIYIDNFKFEFFNIKICASFISLSNLKEELFVSNVNGNFIDSFPIRSVISQNED